MEKELCAKLPTEEEDEQLQKARKFADFQTELQKLIPVWENKRFSARKEFINLFVKEAILETVAPHWVRLTIAWSHPKWENETLYIFRQRGAMPIWTDEEKELISIHYPQRPRAQLLELLSDKSWASITQAAAQLGIERKGLSYCDIPKNVTWLDWQFMQQFGIEEGDRTTKCVPSSTQLV